jgi:hypothetical protein
LRRLEVAARKICVGDGKEITRKLNIIHIWAQYRRNTKKSEENSVKKASSYVFFYVQNIKWRMKLGGHLARTGLWEVYAMYFLLTKKARYYFRVTVYVEG